MQKYTSPACDTTAILQFLLEKLFLMLTAKNVFINIVLHYNIS